MPLNIAQIQKTQPESPVALIMGETDQVIGNLNILGGQLRLIAVAGLADTERQAGQLNADTPVLYGLLRHLASARWRYHFFCIAS
jgi:hypothetical protein